MYTTWFWYVPRWKKKQMFIKGSEVAKLFIDYSMYIYMYNTYIQVVCKHTHNHTTQLTTFVNMNLNEKRYQFFTGFVQPVSKTIWRYYGYKSTTNHAIDYIKS